MIVDNQVMDKIRLFYRVKEEYLDIVFETIKKILVPWICL